MREVVPETAIDYDEVFRRGGRNHGDEDFALMKCPVCRHVYLFEYEVDTIYLDGKDLSRRVPVFGETFSCVSCGNLVPDDEPVDRTKGFHPIRCHLGRTCRERLGLGGKAAKSGALRPPPCPTRALRRSAGDL
jgi:hypothetical protein